MATEPLLVRHTAGQTVYFRFYDPDQSKFYDFDDDTWQASPTDPKLAAAENTDAGDSDESLYEAEIDLALLNATASPRHILVQALDDLATDAIISEALLTVSSGESAPDSSGTAKLDAVNEMLECVNEYPVDELDTGGTSYAAQAERILNRVEERIQSEGWFENTENEAEFTPDENDKIAVAGTILKFDARDSSEELNIGVRSGYMYNLDDQTDEFDGTVYATLVRRLAFSDLSIHVRRAIIEQAKQEFYEFIVGEGSRLPLLLRTASRAMMDARRHDQDREDVNILDSTFARRMRGSYPGMIETR